MRVELSESGESFCISKPSLDNPGMKCYWSVDPEMWISHPKKHSIWLWMSEKAAYSVMMTLMGR